MSQATPKRGYRPRATAVAMLTLAVVYLALAVATQRGYGVGWDCWGMYGGDRHLYFFLTFDPAYLDYSKPMPMPLYEAPGHPDFQAVTLGPQGAAIRNLPHHFWPVGDLAGSVACQVFFRWLGWLDPIDARNLASILFGLGIVIAVYRFAHRYLGAIAAGTAAMTLAVHPHFWSHLHYNPKDIPCALFFTLTICLFYRGVVSGRGRWVVGSAVCWGLGLATKANLLFMPVLLIPWFGWLAWRQYLRPRRWPPAPLMAGLALYPFVGIACMLVAWPYLLAEFPSHLLDYYDYLTQFAYSSSDYRPWQPLLKLLTTTPTVMLGLAAAGLFRCLWRWWRTRRLHPLPVLVAGWIVLTVGRVSLPGAQDFDGIRHWLEVLPAMALLAGLGGQALVTWLSVAGRGRVAWLRQLRRPLVAWLLVGVSSASVVLWIVRNHPYEIMFYNSLAGGAPGARNHRIDEVTDYWCASYRNGMRWLNRHAGQDALVIVAFADHIFSYTDPVWLRRDLRICRASAMDAPALAAIVRDQTTEVYLIYVTREEFYT